VPNNKRLSGHAVQVSPSNYADGPSDWPTFTFFVKVGTLGVTGKYGAP